MTTTTWRTMTTMMKTTMNDEAGLRGRYDRREGEERGIKETDWEVFEWGIGRTCGEVKNKIDRGHLDIVR
jgi:hypothetical protein